MARHYKRFDEHSERWKRQARKDGITSERWNQWLSLSDRSRNYSDPRSYGKGVPVSAQRLEGKRSLAKAAMKRARKNVGRANAIDHNVSLMTEKELDWTIKATSQQIRLRAQQKTVPGRSFNLWRMYQRGS